MAVDRFKQMDFHVGLIVGEQPQQVREQIVITYKRGNPVSLAIA